MIFLKEDTYGFQDTEQLLAIFSFSFHYWVFKSQFAIILQFMIFFSIFPKDISWISLKCITEEEHFMRRH